MPLNFVLLNIFHTVTMIKVAGELQRILDRRVDNKKIFGTSFAIQYKGATWAGASGDLTTDTPYFIASVTKLFVTAVILRLVADGKLTLDDKIAGYLEPDTLKGLHMLNGKNYAAQITVRHLLAHTSGIPDYFSGRDQHGGSMEKDLFQGKDCFYTFEELIALSKSMKPAFVPAQKGKALYSDTNFQLLGRIIEKLTGASLEENYKQYIIGPASLSHTYLYTDCEDARPKDIYYKTRPLHIPRIMTCFGPDGGVVSTASDMLRFIAFFFNGGFFPITYVESLRVWNPIFYPMQSGIGIHRFKLPWLLNPTGLIPELNGHSGLSGAVAFQGVGKDIYIAGTVNQLAYNDISFRTAIKLMQKVLS